MFPRSDGHFLWNLLITIVTVYYKSFIIKNQQQICSWILYTDAVTFPRTTVWNWRYEIKEILQYLWRSVNVLRPVRRWRFVTSFSETKFNRADMCTGAIHWRSLAESETWMNSKHTFLCWENSVKTKSIILSSCVEIVFRGGVQRTSMRVQWVLFYLITNGWFQGTLLSNNNVAANGLITYEEVVSKETFARIMKITHRTLVFC